MNSFTIILGVILCPIVMFGIVAAVTECDGKLCIHGTCSGTTCTCDIGYVGPRCGTSADDCASNPCLNGATCIDGHQTYSCKCASGFEGQTCGIHSGCKRAFCFQGSTCVADGSDYTCDCPAGYAGKHCDSITESLTVSRVIGVTASSSSDSGEPEYAIDGVLNAYHNATNYCSHTDTETNPFWTVFLNDTYPIRHVRVHNNAFNGEGHYFRNIEMHVDDTLVATWNAPDSSMFDREIIDFYLPEGTHGRNLNISKVNDAKLVLCEVEVWGYIHD